MRIRVKGGDPLHGGKQTGSTNGWDGDKNLQGYFYLFKDSDYPKTRNLIGRIFSHRLIPSIHTFLSGYNFASYHLTTDNRYLRVFNCIIPIFSTLNGLINMAITPTLRFRFSKIDSNRLVNDDNYPVPVNHPDRGNPKKGFLSYKTSQQVEAWRIGVLGSLIIRLKSEDVPVKPSQMLLGTIQLTCAVALCVIQSKAISACPAAFVVGMLIA